MAGGAAMCRGAAGSSARGNGALVALVRAGRCFWLFSRWRYRAGDAVAAGGAAFGIMIVLCIFESHEHKDVKPIASAPRSNRSWSSSLPGASPESGSLTMIHGRPPSGRGPPSTIKAHKRKSTSDSVGRAEEISPIAKSACKCCENACTVPCFSFHVSRNLPFRHIKLIVCLLASADARPPVPWRHTVEGAD